MVEPSPEQPEGLPQPISRPLRWEDHEDTPILFANQLLVQHVQNEFVISFGQMTPPPWPRPPSQEELDAFKYVPVKTIARIGLTPDRLLEMIKVLQANYRNYQATKARQQSS